MRYCSDLLCTLSLSSSTTVTPDYRELQIGLAAASAAIGAVVVVFVLFGLQTTWKDVEGPQDAELLARDGELEAQRLMLWTSFPSMAALLFVPLFLFYHMATGFTSDRAATLIAMFIFSFAITVLLVGLFVLVLAIPRTRRTARAVIQVDAGQGQGNAY